MTKAHRHLQLVHPRTTSARRANGPGAEQHEYMAWLELTSAAAVAKSVSPSFANELFDGLLPDERVEFVHELQQPDASPAGLGARAHLAPRYRFAVHCASATAAGLAPLLERMAGALAASCPPMHFVVGHPNAGPKQQPLAGAKPATLWAHAWQITLAPMLARTRPAPARFGGESAADSECHPLPHWGDLPEWAFTALTERLNLPAQVQVRVRCQPFVLLHAAAEQLARLRHRLGQSLVLFRPGAALAPHAVATDATEPCQALLQRWLADPSPALAFDCVVQASAALSPVALRRIAADVFGKRSTHIAAWPAGAAAAASAPLLHWAVRREQGMPAVFPMLPQLRAYGMPLHFDAPAVLPPADGGARIGRTVCGAASSVVALPDANRSRHMAVFGATGSGKSSMLLQLLAEDLASPARPGIALIDPHGTLVHEVLRLIPHDRVDDVVLVDITDTQQAASINPLQGCKGNRALASFMANEVVSLVDTLFEGPDTSGPTGRAHLRTALQLATCTPGRDGTFLDALRCWEDEDYGDYLASKCTDRALASAWQRLRQSSGSDHGFKAWLPFLLPRLAPFATSPAMRRLLNCPKSTVNIAQAMRDGKVLLFNLSRSVLGETEGRVAGNLVLNMLFAAALARGRQPGVAHRPMHLVIDELQSYATESTSALFAEARKFGLAITSANQSLGQLRNRSGQATIANGVLANSATKVMLRLSPSDAEILQPYFRPQFDTAEMSTLPDFHGVLSMPAQGQLLPPFVARFDRPVPCPAVHAPWQAVVAASNAQHVRPTAVVNHELMAAFELDEDSLGGGLSDAGEAPEGQDLQLALAV